MKPTRAAVLATIAPRSLSGGQKAGKCPDHPNRDSVFVHRDGRWIDTGLCPSDLNRLVRAAQAVAR